MTDNNTNININRKNTRAADYQGIVDTPLGNNKYKVLIKVNNKDIFINASVSGKSDFRKAKIFVGKTVYIKEKDGKFIIL